MLQKPNVLVFDEPTEPPRPSKASTPEPGDPEVEGTVFLVTHDEDLIEEARHPHLALRRRPHKLPHHRPQGPYEEYQQQLALSAK